MVPEPQRPPRVPQEWAPQGGEPGQAPAERLEPGRRRNGLSLGGRRCGLRRLRGFRCRNRCGGRRRIRHGHAAVAAARIVGLAAGRQDLCLPRPVLLVDAALEIERLIEALDVDRRQAHQVLEAADAEILQPPLQNGIDAADAGQIIARARTALLDLQRRGGRLRRPRDGHGSRGFARGDAERALETVTHLSRTCGHLDLGLGGIGANCGSGRDRDRAESRFAAVPEAPFQATAQHRAEKERRGQR